MLKEERNKFKFSYLDQHFPIVGSQIQPKQNSMDFYLCLADKTQTRPTHETQVTRNFFADQGEENNPRLWVVPIGPDC